MSSTESDPSTSSFPGVQIPQVRNLPPTAKLFVGLFTFLMLCVTFWAAFLYTVDRGIIDPTRAAAIVPYQFNGDPGDTLAPQYDSLYSAADSVYSPEDEAIDMQPADTESPLRKNLGLAHTHINGQTLLFFAIGLVFLGTSLPEQRKRIVFIAFAAAVLVHNIGLTGMGFHWFFDDILAISGVVILVAILFMAFVIFTDLVKHPQGESHG